MDLAPAIRLIKEFEGLVLHAYRDSVGVLTIGWGHTHGVRANDRITLEQAEAFLAEDISQIVPRLDAMIRPDATNNERCALLSFCFNLGISALHHSHLLTYFNRGDRIMAANQFLLWDHAGGKRLPGLTKRREAERALFLAKETIT